MANQTPTIATWVRYKGGRVACHACLERIAHNTHKGLAAPSAWRGRPRQPDEGPLLPDRFLCNIHHLAEAK
jgi:hypothetical protein